VTRGLVVGAPTTGSKKGRFISAGQGGSPPCPAYFLQDASTKGGSSWAGGKGEASHQRPAGLGRAAAGELRASQRRAARAHWQQRQRAGLRWSNARGWRGAGWRVSFERPATL